MSLRTEAPMIVLFFVNKPMKLRGVCVDSSGRWPSSWWKLVQFVSAAGHRVFLNLFVGAIVMSMCFLEFGLQINPFVDIMVDFDCKCFNFVVFDLIGGRMVVVLDGAPALILFHGLQSVCECSHAMFADRLCFCFFVPTVRPKVSLSWCRGMCVHTFGF